MTAGKIFTVLRDIIGLAGVGLFAFGAWLAWPPAGFMAAGALLMLGAWLLARGEA